MRTPTNVNIRNPLAIERVVEEINAGRARNYSEAAENLILGNRRPVTSVEGNQPISENDARNPVARAGSVA